MRQTPADYAAYVAAGSVGLAGAAYGLGRDLTILLATATGGAILGGKWLWGNWRKSQQTPSLMGGQALNSLDASVGPRDVSREGPSTRRSHYFVLALILLGVTAITILDILDDTTEVVPDHSEAVMEGAMGVALLAAITTFALTTRVRLRPDVPRWLSSLTLSVAAALMCGITAMFVIDRSFQFLDFPQTEIVQSVAYLPIERAYRTGSGRDDYNIQLAGPFANLDVDAVDYEAAFNGAKDINPVGFCLRATIQRVGQAMRIMHSSAKPFAPGSVVKCPDKP